MLTLPIKKKWFDMICSGEKREEYRIITDYYGTRFRNVWGYSAYWGEPPQPITNADRIRNMTDEELAEWIFRDQMNIFKMACDAFGYTEYDEKKMERWDDILSWLRQEAGE